MANTGNAAISRTNTSATIVAIPFFRFRFSFIVNVIFSHLHFLFSLGSSVVLSIFYSFIRIRALLAFIGLTIAFAVEFVYLCLDLLHVFQRASKPVYAYLQLEYRNEDVRIFRQGL